MIKNPVGQILIAENINFIYIYLLYNLFFRKVGKASLELLILFSQSFECLDYRCVHVIILVLDEYMML